MSLDQVRIDEVIVGERARRDYGDLTDLMESIREHGILQPIGLAPGNHLLFGGRRLEAARRLGMTAINVTRPSTQTDALSLLRAERDENTCRKDMTPEELVDMGLRIEELEAPKARERQVAGLRQGDRPSVSMDTDEDRAPEITDPNYGPTSHTVGEALGVSPAHYSRMKSVVRTARGETDDTPEVQQAAQEALDDLNAGKVGAQGAHKRISKARKPGFGDEARSKSNLTRPQPPKFGGNRKKHVAVIDSIAISLTGLAMAAEDITEFDNTVTQEEAARLANDLSTSIRSINRLKQALNRKATP